MSVVASVSGWVLLLSLALHAVLGLVTTWAAHHVGVRWRNRQPLFTDACCADCAALLGWSQLPLVGRVSGCPVCGSTGPVGHVVIELVGAVTYVVAIWWTPLAFAFAVYLALIVIALTVGRCVRIGSDRSVGD